MSHAGKAYPSLMANDWTPRPLFNRSWAPRKWKMIFTSTSVGTLTIPWRGLTIISDVGVRDISTNLITWNLDHPTVSGDRIEFTWRLHQVFPPTVIRTPYEVEMIFDYYHGATRMATRKHTTITDPYFEASTHRYVTFTQWNDLVTPAQWDSTFALAVFAASWADQPEYHPWRA